MRMKRQVTEKMMSFNRHVCFYFQRKSYIVAQTSEEKFLWLGEMVRRRRRRRRVAKRNQSPRRAETVIRRARKLLFPNGCAQIKGRSGQSGTTSRDNRSRLASNLNRRCLPASFRFCRCVRMHSSSFVRHILIVDYTCVTFRIAAHTLSKHQVMATICNNDVRLKTQTDTDIEDGAEMKTYPRLLGTAVGCFDGTSDGSRQFP